MADEPEMVIPVDRLPPGFAERVSRPVHDVPVPRPAATVVLVRDGAAAPELLLMKRHRASGFVPGAYVFPGGVVDAEDADPQLLRLLERPPEEPPPSYWLGGIREVFEETGVLLARDAVGAACLDAKRDPGLAHQREALLGHAASLLDVLRAVGARPDLSRMVYCAHWITPVAEPRRFDTRFFLAALPESCEAVADEREMSDAIWISAADAVAAFGSGRLPMVFPTIKTVQRLVGFRTVDGMLERFRNEDVPAVLPRLVRTADGVGIVLDDDSEA